MQVFQNRTFLKNFNGIHYQAPRQTLPEPMATQDQSRLMKNNADLEVTEQER